VSLALGGERPQGASSYLVALDCVCNIPVKTAGGTVETVEFIDRSNVTVSREP